MGRSLHHIPDLDAFARRLKERREGRGLSQRQLAFPGCTAAYISRLEAAARTPSRQMIDALAVRLETTREWLETGVDPSDAVTVALDWAELDAEMARWFGESALPVDEPLTWENLDDGEREALIEGMRNAALKHAGGMAGAITVNRRLRQQRLADLEQELAEHLRSATETFDSELCP